MKRETPRQNKPEAAQGQKVSLLVTMADTTWRMLVPSALFVLGGVWADLHFGTKPWLTLAAVGLGLAVSAWLIKRQLSGIIL